MSLIEYSKIYHFFGKFAFGVCSATAKKRDTVSTDPVADVICNAVDVPFTLGDGD